MTCTPQHPLATGCTDCTARTLAASGLGEVGTWYMDGLISQYAYDAYMHVTASLQPGPGFTRHRAAPTNPRTVEYVTALRAHLTASAQ